MSLGTFTTSAVSTLLEGAGVPDLLLGKTVENISLKTRTLFDEVNAALVAAGEATFVDNSTTRLEFSAGSKAFLTRLANAEPTSWEAYAPFTRSAQAQIDALLATTDSTDSTFSYGTPPTTADPDFAAIADNVISQGNAAATALIAKARDAIAAAFEKWDPSCNPARTGNAWTFTTMPKTMMLIMAGSTPTVLPTSIYQAEYDRLKAAFESFVKPGVVVTEDVAVTE